MGLLHLQLIKPAFLAIRYDMLTFFSWEGGPLATVFSSTGGGVSSAAAAEAAAAAAAADGFSAPPSSGLSTPLLFIASASTFAMVSRYDAHAIAIC